jgi:hypothetical protein
MPIILAIEPDRRQRHALGAVVRQRVGAELILADTTERALEAIGNRVPDLVLVPALLSPQDDAALAAALRVIAAAAHVRTLTIPVLATETKASEPRTGLLARWRRGRDASPAPDGCDPAVFADQVTAYLAEAAAARATVQDDGEDAYARGGFDTSDRSADMASPALYEETADALDQTFVLDSPAAVYPAYVLPVAADETLFVVDEPVAAVHEASVAATMEVLAADNDSLTAPEDSAAINEVMYVEEPPVAAPVELLIASDEVFTTVESPTAIEAPMFAAAYGRSEQQQEEDIDLSGEVAELGGDEDIVIATSEADLVGGELTGAFAVSMLADGDTAIAEPLSLETELLAIAENGPRAIPEAAEPLVPQLVVNDEDALEQIIEEFATGADAPVHADLMAEFAVFPAEAADPDAWLSGSLGRPHTWPRLEGVPAEIMVEGARAVAPAARTVAPAARERTDRPAPAPTRERNEWTELVASLRQDIERRRAEPARAETPATVAAPKPRRQAAAAKAKPAQDEWGFFDPQQCGFAALLAKLDEITEAPEERDSPRH